MVERSSPLPETDEFQAELGYRLYDSLSEDGILDRLRVSDADVWETVEGKRECTKAKHKHANRRTCVAG
jgi:hypothetical protein